MSSGFVPPRPCCDPYDRLTPEELKAMIDQVRSIVLQDCEEHPDEYDPADIDQLRNHDWQVERFIRRKHTLEDTVGMVKDTLKWRHGHNMPQLKSDDFPEEFFKVGTMFDYDEDRAGNAMVYMRVRRHKKLKEIEHDQKKFILYIVDKADKRVDGRGLAVVFDCKGTGLSNLDMDILWFLLQSMVKYFPAGLSYILVYDLPWVLAHVWNMINAWLPPEYRDLIKFVGKHQLFDYVDPANVPRYMGGQCARNMYTPPKEALPFDHPKFEHKFTEKQLKLIEKHFLKYLEEAQAEERKFYSGGVVETD